MAAAVRALTAGRGADFVFDTVGSPATLALALAATRKGGAVVLTGLSRMDAQAAIRDVSVRDAGEATARIGLRIRAAGARHPAAGVAVSGRAS